MREILRGGKELIVEIGFGNGEYLIHLARNYPPFHIIGIERSPRCVIKALSKIEKEGLSNASVLWMEANVALRMFFPDERVYGFYFNFPDPWPKKRHEERRIFTEEFIDLLWVKLKRGGFVEIATDWAEYAWKIAGLFMKRKNFESAYPFPFFLNFIPFRFRTKYERIHHLQHGDPVFYMRFLKL